MNTPWGATAIEWLRVLAAIATPIVLWWLGFRTLAYADRLERRRRSSAVGAEWRLEVFRELLKHFNRTYCYFTYQGDWLLLSLDDATEAKRAADRIVYANKFLWSPEFMEAYRRFNTVAYVENRGPGKEFQFRANVTRHRENPAWQATWADRFVSKEERVTRKDFICAYNKVISRAVRDLGIVSEADA